MIQNEVTVYILQFDICTICLLAMIQFSLVFRRMTKGASNLAFLVLTGIVTATTVFDLLAMYFSIPVNTGKIPGWLFYAFHTLYFLFRQMNMPAYVMYIIIMSGSWTVMKERANRYVLVLLILPFSAFVVCLAVNVFHSFMYSATQTDGYRRLSGMWIMYAMALYYMAFVMIFTIKYRKLFPRGKFAAMSSIVPLSIIAVVIQMFDSSLLIEMFSTSCSILLVTITIHRPEQLISTELGAFSRSSFLEEQKKAEILKKHFVVIYAKIKNFDHICSFLDHASMQKFLENIYQGFLELDALSGFRGTIFYLEEGFFAVMSERGTVEKAEAFAGSIYDMLRRGISFDRLKIQIVPQVCYLQYPQIFGSYDRQQAFVNSFQNLLPDADKAINLADIADTRDFMLRSRMDAIIAEAITNGRFQMYYQPIYSVRKNKFVSAEALIRLKDEEYGFISPELFIAVAEKNGAIYQIGDFIIDDVCRFIASPEFRKTGLDYIEVNLAVAQCVQPDLPARIESIVKKHGIRFEQLNFEVTERESVADQKVFLDNIKALKQLGSTISLDDYGTGYSNIQRVANMPLHIVKIDKSFVDNINDPQMEAIVKSTVVMIKNMNKMIVVEGIEDKETLQKFKDLDCDYIQGYYFSRPLPEKDFLNFFKTSKI